MQGTNLIPQRRLQARRRAARVRLWSSVVPALASALMGTYGWLRAAWPTDTTTIISEMASVEGHIKTLEFDVKGANAQIEQQRILMRANESVGSQPDWGLLLMYIAGRLGHETVLQGCVLEPVAAAPSGSTSAAPQGSRPAQFRLTLAGMGKSQKAVADFVRELDRKAPVRLFDRVALVESRRVPFAGREAISFRIECTLTDPAAEVR